MNAARRSRNESVRLLLDAEARRRGEKNDFTAEAPRRRGKPKRTAPLRWNAARLPCGFEGAENNWLVETSSRRATRRRVSGYLIFSSFSTLPSRIEITR